MCVYVTLHKYRSRTKVQEFVDNYNNGLPLKSNGKKQLSKMLRGQHVHLIEHLIELLHLEIKKKMAANLLEGPGTEFPSLRTNCAQLSKRLKASERTVRNLRTRLRESGIIAAEQWHGSNASIEIWLNPDLVHMTLQKAKNADNISDLFLRPTMGSSLENKHLEVIFLPAKRQTLPHTVTSTNTRTNKLNILSGAILPPNTDNQSVMVKKETEECAKPVSLAKNSVEKPQLSKNQNIQDTDTGYTTCNTQNLNNPPSSATPPTEIPNSFSDVAEGLSHKQKITLQRHTERLYRVLVTTLYSDRWIADSERERTLARLAEYLRYGSPERWTRGANEVSTRITLAGRYIRDKYPDGFNMPLPSSYVDIRNDRKVSLVKTKTWYKKHKEQVWDIKNKEILTKAINEYHRSLQDGSKVSPTEAYRKIQQRLSKRDKNLFNEFLKAITDVKAAA